MSKKYGKFGTENQFKNRQLSKKNFDENQNIPLQKQGGIKLKNYRGGKSLTYSDNIKNKFF